LDKDLLLYLVVNGILIKNFAKKKATISRFQSYLDYVKFIGSESGYNVEIESLRIPSTRNIGIIGRNWNIDLNDEEDLKKIKNNQKNLLSASGFQSFVPKIRNHGSKH